MKDKIKGKIEKHYDILVNGQKCKILNYKIDGSELTIITKIKNSNLWMSRNDKGEICIEDENKRHFFSVKGLYAHYSTTIFNYSYLIIEEERIEAKSTDKIQ